MRSMELDVNSLVGAIDAYNLKSDNNYAKFSEFIILLREKLT